MSRPRFACLLLLLTVFFAPSVIAAATPDEIPAADRAVVWPGKDVALTVPFAESNESDLYCSLFPDAFAAKTGWRLRLRYFAAEAGAQAWARMADDGPDGYNPTGVNIPHIILRGLAPDSGVDPKTMSLCVIFAYTPCVLWSPKPNPSALRDFIETARKAPGSPLVAGPGRHSAAQLAARMLDRNSGVHSGYLPYAGSSEAAGAAREGKATLFWAHTVTLPGFAGAVPVAVAAEQRHPALPHTPTFRELGYDVVQGTTRGLAVPADTPKDIRRRIATVFAGLNADPALRAKAASLGFSSLDLDYEKIPVWFAAQSEKYRRLAEDYEMNKQD